MCGIAGIYSKNPVACELVDRMLAQIGYRGPDHCEVQAFRGGPGGYLTVGQVRLAILDPSPEANQPFVSDHGKSSLTFNGEFYNFEPLGAALAKTGIQFKTNSDTEVALHLFDQNGYHALDQLWGMFAGAYFRSKDGSLLLFRDRLGQKPLYFYEHGDRLYFASEPKAILAVLDHRPPPDDRALRYYFYLGYLPDELTAFKGMRRLAAGHALKLRPNQPLKIWRWYDPEKTELYPEADLETLFLDAVRLRMISDVPLAAFLSGGLDSSLVVAAMSRLAPTRVNTFSVRFEGPQVLDESPYARMVAKHCGTDHQEIVLNSETLQKVLPEVVDHFDEPFGDSSAVPMYLVSKAARQHFTVALSGDGADELFAGYRKYLGESYLKRLGPHWLRRGFWSPLSRLLPTGRGHRVLEFNRRFRRLLRGDGPTPATRHIHWLNMNPVDGLALLGPRLSESGFDPVIRSLGERLPNQADLNDCLRFDQDLVLRDDMFVKVDRMSMKASLEVRSPFVDHRLVRLANGLAPQRKLSGGQRKAVLLQRLGHWLPSPILSRPKTGFEMPIGAWLRGPLRSWSEKRLFDWGDTSAWVNREALQKAWRAHQSGQLDCSETLWHHLVFSSWLQAYHG